MRRAVLAGLLAGLVAGCGVEAEDVPEPLPPSSPVVLPPTVVREPAPSTPPNVR